MDIKIDIISKEIIKPSSPSPKSPKSHKLSLLDQKAANCYTTFILFFQKDTSSDLENVLDSLKAKAAGIRCPAPILLRLHVLVMEFIGNSMEHEQLSVDVCFRENREELIL
ncbi:hypothetical protein BC332_13309 [Capsicum chinense]|nr:hypothetical protein BC332_13309 [Capsicum chinense]